jgi:hypothetical protein
MLKATLFSALVLCYLSASSRGSAPSSKRFAKPNSSPNVNPPAPPATSEQSHFVIITPPVTWKSAKDVCEMNGYTLAKLNEQNLQIAVNFVNSAKHSRVWIESYMGHGEGDNAAVMLRPSKNPPKPSTIKIMRNSKAAQCNKIYPVLCVATRKCPPSESSSSRTHKKCKKEKKGKKKCPGNVEKSSSKKETTSNEKSSKKASDPPCGYYASSSSSSSSTTSMSDSLSYSYSISNDSYSRSYSYEYSPFDSSNTSTYYYSGSSSPSSSFTPSTVIEINIVKSKKKGGKTKK